LSIEMPARRSVVSNLSEPVAELALNAQAPAVDVGRFVVQLPRTIARHLRQESCLRLRGSRKVNDSVGTLHANQIRFIEEPRDHKGNALLRMGSQILRAGQIVITPKTAANRAAAASSGSPGKSEAWAEVLPGWVVKLQIRPDCRYWVGDVDQVRHVT